MSKSKAKGTRYETQVASEINRRAGDTVAERVVLHGNRDNGDLRLTLPGHVLTVECKWREKYPGGGEELDFREQTLKETEHAGTEAGILVVNRYRIGIERHECWMQLWVLDMLCGREYDPEQDMWVMVRMGEFCDLLFGKEEA